MFRVKRSAKGAASIDIPIKHTNSRFLSYFFENSSISASVVVRDDLRPTYSVLYNYFSS